MKMLMELVIVVVLLIFCFSGIIEAEEPAVVPACHGEWEEVRRKVSDRTFHGVNVTGGCTITEGRRAMNAEVERKWKRDWEETKNTCDEQEGCNCVRDEDDLGELVRGTDIIRVKPFNAFVLPDNPNCSVSGSMRFKTAKYSREGACTAE